MNGFFYVQGGITMSKIAQSHPKIGLDLNIFILNSIAARATSAKK